MVFILIHDPFCRWRHLTHVTWASPTSKEISSDFVSGAYFPQGGDMLSYLSHYELISISLAFIHQSVWVWLTGVPPSKGKSIFDVPGFSWVTLTLKRNPSISTTSAPQLFCSEEFVHKVLRFVHFHKALMQPVRRRATLSQRQGIVILESSW